MNDNTMCFGIKWTSLVGIEPSYKQKNSMLTCRDGVVSGGGREGEGERGRGSKGERQGRADR